VIGAIADLDADVTLIEATRSRMEILDDLTAAGFANSVGALVSTTSTRRESRPPARSPSRYGRR
jgi:methionine synthase II (cobalamin-independent)